MYQEMETRSGQPGSRSDSPLMVKAELLNKSPQMILPLGITLIGVLALAWILWLTSNYLGIKVPLNSGQGVIFKITPGESLRLVSKRLQIDGLLSSARSFEALAKKANKTQSIRAGEFQLVIGWTPERILEELTTSPGLLTKVQVREGLSWWETIQAVTASGTTIADEFYNAIFDLDLLEQEHIPSRSPEGFLFPETYSVSKGAENNGRILAEAMFREFWKNAQKIWPAKPPEPAELLRVVTLASLVEKESGDLSERARIAGVFVNRLRLGMRLQSDPTIIYGLGQDFGGDLKRTHLNDGTNIYNTYKIIGLPPGPICSPGLVSLQAAAAPEKHWFLYFVAKGDGTHFFSKNLEEHNQAVYKFQKQRN